MNSNKPLRVLPNILMIFFIIRDKLSRFQVSLIIQKRVLFVQKCPAKTYIDYSLLSLWFSLPLEFADYAARLHKSCTDRSLLPNHPIRCLRLLSSISIFITLHPACLLSHSVAVSLQSPFLTSLHISITFVVPLIL